MLFSFLFVLLVSNIHPMGPNVNTKLDLAGGVLRKHIITYFYPHFSAKPGILGAFGIYILGVLCRNI